MITNEKIQKLASYLIFVGMILSFCALAITNQAIRANANKGLLYTELVEKPRIYYPFHGGQLVCMVSAGLLALLAMRKHAYKVGLYPFLLLAVVGIYMGLRGYGADEIFSRRIINPRGPMQCWISVVAFAGVGYLNWRWIGRGLYVVAGLLSIYCLFITATLGTVSRSLAMNNLTTPLNPLYWTGLYVLLVTKRAGVLGALKWLPIAVYSLGSIITQTRLNLLMVALAFLAYLFLRSRESQDIKKPLVTVFLSLTGVILVIGILAGTSFQETLDYYESALQNRLTQDSRSEQVVAFFDDVPPETLIFGKGAEAAWNWDGELWKGGTDVGYLSVLFFGGIPMLLGICCFIVRPGFTNLASAKNRVDLIGPIIVLLFSIRMFSSEFPSLDIEYYPILLAAGRCWGYLLAKERLMCITFGQQELGRRSLLPTTSAA